MSRLMTGVLPLLLLAAACSSTNEQAPITSSEEATTVAPVTTATTSTAAPATTAAPTTITTTTTTTTTLPPKGFPTSGLVAFTSDRAGSGALFVIDPTDGEIRQIGHGMETMFAPAWSPDGRHVVYVELSGQSSLMIIDAAAAWDGEVQPIELTDGSLEVDQPAWSPDGTTIAFKVTTEEDRVPEVWSVEVEGGEPERLLTMAEGPAFSPDGQHLAFVEVGDRESAIAVLDLGTGAVTRLTDPADRATTPAWSPDGSQIAFTSGVADFDVWVIDAGGGSPSVLAGEPDREWWPCWTGVGEIAYARFNPDTLHDIWVADLSTGATSPLVEHPADDWWPACQPVG